MGPEAALPVMEGKSLLFKYLGGVDAVPLPLATRNQEDLVKVVQALEPSFGGINLEDIESPKCFYLLEELQRKLKIPVWHDDQQGTAGAALAALINAMDLTGKTKEESKVVLYGAGAANIATARLLISYGFPAGNLILVDREGPLYSERRDLDSMMFKHRWKYELAIKTNSSGARTLDEAFKGADVLIAASSPGPGVIPKRFISMMRRPIVFALANPTPEIMPQEAKEAGAEVIATGRSDFPNQVNNSLIFPAVFRGVLDSKASKVDDSMVIEASSTLAAYARAKGLSRDYIIPRMDEWEVYYEVAAAVAHKAVELGYARFKASKEEFRRVAKERIIAARKVISEVNSVVD